MSDKHDDGCACGCGHEDPELLTLTDENGNETDFVIIEGLEHNETLYLALVEAEHADDEECEFIILKNIADGDEDSLISIEDEDEFNTVRELFEAKMENAGLFEFEEVEEDVED